MKEAEIIRLCKKGDQAGFKALVDTYATKLMGVSLRYMKNEFEAKDVLQDSFIRIFQHIDQYKPKGSLESYLTKIVINSALMQLRKNKKFKNQIEYESHSVNGFVANPGVEIKLHEEEILAMIQELPDHYRVIFNLYIIEEYNHAEIAHLLGIKESTSRTKLARARQKVKEIYQKRIKSSDRKEIIEKEAVKIS